MDNPRSALFQRRNDRDDRDDRDDRFYDDDRSRSRSRDQRYSSPPRKRISPHGKIED